MPPRLLQTGSQWRAFLGAPSNRAASLHTHARAAPYPRRPLSHPANAFITSRKGAIALLSTLVACSFSGKPGAPEPLPTAHRAPLLALPPRTVLRRVHTSSRRAQQSPPIVDSTPAQHHVELDRVTLATPARSTFEFLSRYHGARAAAKTRRTGAGTASLPNAPPNAPRPWRPDQPGAPSLVDPDRAFTPEGILQQQHHEQTKSTLASAVNGARLSSLSSKTASTSALPQASQTSGDMGAGRQIGDSSYMSDSSVGSSRGATGGGAGGGQSGDRIHDLIRHPALYDPIRAPRFPIVLCHGELSKSSTVPEVSALQRACYCCAFPWTWKAIRCSWLECSRSGRCLNDMVLRNAHSTVRRCAQRRRTLP